MVKFNTTNLRSLKYKNKANTFAPLAQRIDSSVLSVAKCREVEELLNAKYFGELNDDYSQLRFHVDGKTYKHSQSVTEVFESICGDVVKGAWNLFLDDERQPTDTHCLTSGNCVVARTTWEASKAVDIFGLPKTMYLDYWLGFSRSGDGTIKPFLEHFCNKFKDTKDLWFDWINHSQHEDKRNTDRMLMNLLRDTDKL